MSNEKKSTNSRATVDPYVAFLEARRAMAAARQKTNTEKVIELLGEDTTVIYNGKPVYDLNSSLVLSQEIDASDLRNLKSLHAEKLKYFDLMRETDYSHKLKEYAHEIECIEFEMQKAWRFPQDRTYHEWFKVPKCTCPKMDNSNNRGTNQRIIVMDCPIHGQ